MPDGHVVALLAKVGTRGDEKHVVIRAVRLMAVRAALAHRGVLPQEGAALLRVAHVADVVDAVRLEKRLGDRAVRVVAVGARYLSFGQRHVRTALEFGPLLDVTGLAGLRNARSREKAR